MSKIVITSSDKSDTAVDIEEKLEKAMSVIQSQRDKKQFSDVFLKAKKDKADKIVSAVFSSMIDEISAVLRED